MKDNLTKEKTGNKVIVGIIELRSIDIKQVKDNINVIWEDKVLNINHVFSHLNSIPLSELQILVCSYNNDIYLLNNNDYDYIMKHNLLNKPIDLIINYDEKIVSINRSNDTGGIVDVFDTIYFDELSFTEIKKLKKSSIALGRSSIHNSYNNVIKNRYGNSGIIISDWDKVFDHIEKISNYRYNIDQRELFKIQFETGKQ